ncbi:hypothetical protein [Nocardia gamkensis]|uniref:Uncharacterized protein n=1 Tax=Nocardia gamkensis TaxID=352869 RepID=A0A7X6R5U2_9NOCA|nr:hypothetical protein [Nocardia gamkensis]NKY29920.1 hypothetical protein [Nocardia gamkensis]
MSLFDDGSSRPLADRLRPRLLADVVGQNHLLDEQGRSGEWWHSVAWSR